MFENNKLNRRRFTLLMARLAASIATIIALPAKAMTNFSLSDDAINTLKDSISGEVITRNHKYFQDWLNGLSWQTRKTSRRPALMVQPKSASDVAAAVKFARENELQVGIRSGGHSWVHASIRDDNMLLDLRHFTDIDIDVENRTAVVGPAIRARQLATKLEEVGLAFPVAHCSTVAMGGYLLGGGQAWNWGSWGGAACNSVKALDIVDASGEIMRIDDTNQGELFWAAKGSGGGFPAVVTNYHLQLYPLPKAIHMNSYMWPLKDTLAVSNWLPKVGEVLSDKVELFMFLLGLPEPIDGVDKVVVITGVAFAETEVEAIELLEPMKEAPSIATPILKEEMKAMTMNSLLDLVDRTYPPCRAVVDTFWFDLSMEAVMEKYVDHFAAAPSHLSNVLCEVKPKPIVIPDIAYSMRRLTYLSPYSFWFDEKDDKANIEWMDKTQAILAPLSVGHYINEADLEASPERSERSYSKENWQRIKQVKNKYDPDNLFQTYLGH